MHRISIVKRLAPVAGFLLLCQAPGWAQGPVRGSGEIGGTFGWTSISGADEKSHVAFGGSSGINLSDRTQLFGEYLYNPLGSAFGVNAKANNFGGGLRYHFGPTSSKAVPYFVTFGGLHRQSAGATVGGMSVGASKSAAYFGAGAGVSVYAGKRWGVRPEVRYERIQMSKTNIGGEDFDGSGTALSFGVGIFYQFGGK